MTETERRVLLLSSSLVRRFFGSYLKRGLEWKGDKWVGSFDREELSQFERSLEKDIQFLAPGKDRSILEGVLRKAQGGPGPADGAAPSGFTNEDYYMQQLVHAMKDWNQKSFPELNSVLEDISRSHNKSPIDEFHGLSPNQMYGLLNLGWWGEPKAIILNDNLPADDIAKAPLLHNCRLLLNLLEESGGVKTTTRGNLKRDAVKHINDLAVTEGCDLYDVYRPPGVVNEDDARPVHMARVVCDVAGLLKKRKGRFEITKKGKSLISKGNEGRLFACLFDMYFSRFNLGYCDRCPELAGLQNTFPYTLYRLSEEGEGALAGPESVASSLVHPDVATEISALEEDYLTLERLLDVRLLRHLEIFSLIEISRGMTESGYRARTFSKTKLFDRFISFSL